MTLPPRRALTFAAALVGLLLVAFIGIRALDLSGAGMCDTSVISREPSPDRHASVVVFEHDCGATTDFGIHVALLRAGEDLTENTGGLLFSVDSDHGRAASGPKGGPWVEAHWAGPDSIVIRYDAAARIFRQTVVLDGVRVGYVSVVRVGA